MKGSGYGNRNYRFVKKDDTSNGCDPSMPGDPSSLEMSDLSDPGCSSSSHSASSVSSSSSSGAVATPYQRRHNNNNSKIRAHQPLASLQATKPLRALVDDDSDQAEDYNKKIIVFILSKNAESHETKKTVKIFDHDAFHPIVIHSEHHDWMNKDSYKHHAERQRYAYCFDQARQHYPHHYILIVRDSTISSLNSSEIARILHQAIRNSGWHIFYLSRWNDNCAELKSLEDSVDNHVSLVKTIEPHGLQAVMISPEGRKILEGSVPMQNGDTFPHQIANSEADAKQIDEVLTRRAKNGSLVGEPAAKTQAAEAAGIVAAQNAGADVKAVQTVASSGAVGKGSYLVKAYGIEDMIRENIANGNINAVTTNIPLVHYDNRNNRNHHRLNVCRADLGSGPGNGSHLGFDGAYPNMMLNQNTNNFLYFFIAFAVVLVLIGLVIWFMNEQKKKKAVAMAALEPVRAGQGALPVVATTAYVPRTL